MSSSGQYLLHSKGKGYYLPDDCGIPKIYIELLCESKKQHNRVFIWIRYRFSTLFHILGVYLVCVRSTLSSDSGFVFIEIHMMKWLLTNDSKSKIL